MLTLQERMQAPVHRLDGHSRVGRDYLILRYDLLTNGAERMGRIPVLRVSVVEYGDVKEAAGRVF